MGGASGSESNADCSGIKQRRSGTDPIDERYAVAIKCRIVNICELEINIIQTKNVNL